MTSEWITLPAAAKQFGYSLEGFKQRLRQLRELGYVSDTGNPPAAYTKLKNTGQIVLMWVNPKAPLIRGDFPTEMFNPTKGYRAQATPPAQKLRVKQTKRIEK